MKPFYLVFIILFLNFASEMFAQRSNGLSVEGTVTVEQGSVQGAVIEMYRNGQRLDNYGIGGNGRYRVELNYNNEFVLIFSRKDNFPQKIVVDTRVPKEVIQSDPLFPPFPVNIKLFTEIDGIDKTFSENTVMKIYYSEKVDNFISDLFYNDVQIKHLIDQAILQSQKIGKEADLLAGVTKAELAELRKEYDQLIKQAESEYNREEFLNALDGYKAANKIIPKEQYPKDRIAEINDLLGLQMVAEEMEQALMVRLKALLAQGDMQFEQKKYEDARASYQRSLSIDSENTHAQARLNEITNIVETIQINREYDALIVAADNAFDELLYVEAKNSYAKAFELKSNEKYPQQKIAAIDEILKQQALNAEKLEGYRASIFQAELNFEKQFYDKAISFYENALEHKPGDEVATRKIEEIKLLMNQLANKTLYDKRIQTADRAFKKKQYEEALLEYEEAAKLMPSEGYPRTQIEQINAIYDEQKRLAAEAEAEKVRLAAEAEATEQARLAILEAERERRYNQALSQADSLFRLKEYEESRTAYQSALQVKPGEVLPGQRINEIDNLIGQLAATQQQYEAAVNRGNNAFKQESFEGAKTAYMEAQKAKPEEIYPQQMLTQIDSIVETRALLAAEAEAEKVRLAAEAEAAEQARLAALEAERERQYKQALSQADSLFRLKEYEESRTAYQSALEVKPGEPLPGQRINEIDNLIGQLAATQQQYEAAVSRGNEALKQESFVEAKAAYLEAQKAKPEETYPQQMLTQIDSIVGTRAQLAAEAEAEKVRLVAEAEAVEQARLAAQEAEREKRYNQAISQADSLFRLKEYEESRIAYQSALLEKPGEVLPGQRINEIDNLIGQLAAAQLQYEAAVSRGNVAWKQESFGEAKAAYMEAQKAKPEETYPQQMLTQIDSVMESQAQLAAEAEAEKVRLAAETEAAEQARLAAQEAERERQYNQTISQADSLFRLKGYEESRTAYQSALQVKPGEVLPGQRINEIDNLIKQLAATQQQYEAAINRGNDAFNQESFEGAKAAYLEAQKAKPEETYPQQMLTQIDSILESRAQLAAEAEAEKARLAAEAEAAEQARLAALAAEKEREYNLRIARADSLFSLEEYENSRSEYQVASKIKSEGNYPEQRINEINKILIELELVRKEKEKLDQNYQNTIQLANQQFIGKDFLQAKANYEIASKIKPDESYPKERIAEATKLLQQLEQDEKYSSVILAADGLFQAESWLDARTEYQNALALKPNENYPTSQIVKINNILKQQEERILAEQKAAAEMGRRKIEIEQHQKVIKERQEINETGLNQLYLEYISLADGFFDNKNYNVSRAWYYKAWEIKQDEKYPQQRIDEINQLLSSMQLSQRDRDFQNYINLADSTFRENQLAVSRGWYNRALSVKADDAYPIEQLQAIADLISERIAGRSGEEFNNHIKRASEAFESGNYNVARYWYKKALDLRPDDNDTKEKLNELQNKMSE